MTDLKKYGTQMPTDRMVAASTQGSLSVRAALGLILTKAIYLLKDTEKIGLYVQLIKETMTSLHSVFRVRENFEFTELIHLSLFAFDNVCEFYKD
jgi:L-lactate permease